MSRPYSSEVLDHLGLVAGMFDELGIGYVIDHATQQNPETHFVTVGSAVKVIVLNGLGFVNQQLYLCCRVIFSLSQNCGILATSKGRDAQPSGGSRHDLRRSPRPGPCIAPT
jgi:hypothetical protein